MNGQLENLRRTYESGEPLYRLTNAASARTLLTDEISRLDEGLARNRETFSAELSRWSGAEEEPQRPYEITDQVRKARYATAIGWTLFLAEVALTILLSVTFEVNLVVAAVLAIALPLGVTVGAAVLADCRQNPFETERRIRRFVLLPGVVVLLVSAIVLTAARTFAGELAADIARYVSISLWTLSLGLAVTSSAVLALASLWSWSSAAVRRYVRIEMRLSRYRAELARVTVIETRLSAAVAALVMCLSIPFLAACAQPPAPAAGRMIQPLELDIYVDRSCSPSDGELRSALVEVQRQLPRVVAENGITRVNYLAFAEDGFGASSIASVEMPACAAEAVRAESEATSVFGNLRVAEERERLSRDETRRDLQRVAVANALSRVAAPGLLGAACNGAAPGCTDISGVLSRIRLQGPNRIAVVLTDFEDTCNRVRSETAALGTDAVILILPAKTRPATRRALDTFTDAERASRSMASGAVVGPWFAASELPALVAQARNLRHRSRHPDQRRGT